MPDPTVDVEIRATLEAALAAGAGPGASAALVGADWTVRLAAAGWAGLEPARPATIDTTFAIGSVSKTFTAATILRLRDLGRLSLDDPIARHVPEVAGFEDPFHASSSVTILDLLLHMAGLPCESPSSDPRRWDPVPIDAVLADPGCVTWAVPPGSAHKYSNLGYDLLGAVIARCGGQAYAGAVASLLLEPLGMAATTFGPPVAAAVGHGPPDGNGRRRTSGPAPALGASGGWWLTATDLARWVAVQLDPESAPSGWSPVSIRSAHRAAVVTDPQLGAGYGLGWRVVRRGDHVHVGHGGLTTGFEARIELDPDRGVGVVVLLDGVGPASPTVPLAAALFGLAADTAPAVAIPSPTSEDRRRALPDPTGLTGRYQEVGFATVTTIEPAPSGLWIRADDDPGGPLIATVDTDRFRLVHGRAAGESLIVLRDGHGAIDGINVAGYPMARLPD